MTKQYLFQIKKKSNPNKIGRTYREAKAAERRWIGDDYQLASAINMAIIARGRIAMSFFERVIQNGTSIEQIEKSLKFVGKKFRYDYACSKYVLDAKRKLLTDRINQIRENLRQAVINKKVAREYKTYITYERNSEGKTVPTIKRGERIRGIGYSAMTMEALASYLDRTYSG